MEDIVIDGINITPDLLAEFKRGWAFDAVQARLRQQQAAEERQALGLVAGDSAAGLLQYQIDPFYYHYWGKRESYEIFSDAREMERFARDTPEIKVERKRTARAPGWRPAGSPETSSVERRASSAQAELLDRFGRPVAA